jgi:hypothetical protein
VEDCFIFEILFKKICLKSKNHSGFCLKILLKAFDVLNLTIWSVLE